MNDNDKTVRKESVPPMSSGTQEQGGHLLQTGMMQPPQTPGTLGLIGKYQVIRILGEGGMGQVLLAREPVTDSLVAVKIIKPEFLRKEWAVHRFLTEAQHIFKMSHPSIIRVLEVSDRPEGPYFVMPFMAGGSLAQKIQPGESLPSETILPLARQVAEALQYAHGWGIIHRDLKPSNILLDAEGGAYLCDFGLLRTVFNDSMVDVTRPQVEGTVPYMSPAVAEGKAEDTRCDIYAFGCLLYEMLTGQPPYQGPSVDAVLRQIQAGPPPPIHQLNPNAPAGLAAIAEHAMGRELRDRYATMSDVISDLDRAAQGKEPLGPRGRAKGFRLGRNVLAAIGIVALVALAAFILSNLPGRKPPVPAPAGRDAPPAPVKTTPAPTDANSDLKRGLVLHFSFDKIEGDRVVDESGCGNHGTLASAAVTPGVVGNALSFAGRDSVVTVPHSPTLNLDRDVTLAAWFRAGQNQLSSWPRIIDKFVWTKQQGCLLELENKSGNAYFSLFPDGARSTKDLRSANVSGVLDDRWHHIVGSCDGTQIRLYLDGALRGVAPPVRQIAFSNKELTIGSGFDGNSWFPLNGAIDEVRVYNRALSADEVRQLYILGNPADQFTWTADNGAITITKYTGPGGAVTIPGRIEGVPVTSIGFAAFLERSNLTKLTIPQGVTSIGNWAFSGSSNLTSVTIPSSVTSIGQCAFLGCVRLTSVTIPAGVTSIPVHPRWKASLFDNCLDLTSIVVDAGNPAFSSSADGVLFDKQKTSLVIYPGGKAGHYEIPSGVTRISEVAFRNCAYLTSVTIPESVTTIESLAFLKCYNLRGIYFKGDAPQLGPNAFAEIKKVTLYHPPEAKGWDKEFGGLPTASWNPPAK